MSSPVNDEPDRSPPRRRRRIVLWAGALLLVIALLYFGVGGWFASTMIRDGMLAGRVTQTTGFRLEQTEGTSPTSLGFRGDPRQAFGYDFEEVRIDSPVGPLPAYFVPAEGDVWAIYVHGLGGNREEGYRHLSVLHPAGFPTLLMTYRNDPGVPADPTGMHGFGLSEWRDVEAAVDYALAHGATQVVLDGESMGGPIIGQFLARSDRADRVAALVLDCPALDPPAIIRSEAAEFGFPFPDALASVGTWIADLRFPVDIGESDVLSVVADFGGPVLLAHGVADELVPVETSDRLATSRTAPTTYLRVEGADHVMSWDREPERYREWLNSFLDTIR